MEEEREAQRAFSRLRPLCIELLDVSRSPKERKVILDSLQSVLRDIDPYGLQRFIDYVLLPLLLLLDGAVASRNASLKEKNTSKSHMLVVGDRVAEDVLSCVEVVLQKCRLETTEQMTMLMRKLTGAAMLSASEAAEEFRHGAVKCLKALLENLQPCKSATCMCRSLPLSPFEAVKGSLWDLHRGCKVGSYKVETSMNEVNVCPLGFLQTENMAAAIGHLISLLLQVAEAEAERSGVGSGKLRKDALSTLRVLFLKVGSADALAFFLPGAVRGLASVMRFTKAQVNSGFSTPVVHISGAAGWPAVVEEAIRGIAELLAIVLGDKYAVRNQAISTAETVIVDQDEDVSGATALDVLRDRSLGLHRSDRSGSSSHKTGLPKVESSELVMHEKLTPAKSSEAGTQNDGAGVQVSLQVERNKEWLQNTATRVNTFLSQTFPLLCTHQSPSVRLAVVEAATVLLVYCRNTLEICNTLLLECLLALACDDREHVASAAQFYLSQLLGLQRSVQPRILAEAAEYTLIDPFPSRKELPSVMATLLSSLLEKLPTVVFSANTAMAVSHARRLAAAMYFLGPERVSSCLLGSPTERRRFTTVMRMSLSFNSVFTGSLGQVTSTSHPPIVCELPPTGEKQYASNRSDSQGNINHGDEQRPDVDGIPSMPPWLPRGTGSRLYEVLADVIRLAGVSAISDQGNGTTFLGIMDLLLVDVRLAANELSMYNSTPKCKDVESGKKLRAAATSACVLNEIIYGASEKSNKSLFNRFRERHTSIARLGLAAKNDLRSDKFSDDLLSTEQEDFAQGAFRGTQAIEDVQSLHGKWQAVRADIVKKVLSEFAGDFLHDYMATEIWDEPPDIGDKTVTMRDLPSSDNHQDLAMLQKVLVEGVGVIGLALGKAFEDSGLLGLVLFPLLEKLASSNYNISHAASVSLNTICSNCNYTSVRDLVVANLDLVVDYLCRQFRHLRMHPQSLNLLAAILRYTNAAPDLLPLLGEPLQSVVMELDVMARTSHPQLTVPLLRALREIIRAATSEVGSMLSKAAAAAANWELFSRDEGVAESAAEIHTSEVSQSNFQDSDLEEHVNHFLDRRRHRRAVYNVATSCLVSCGPLLAAKDPQTCLLTLEIIEDGIRTLSQAEEAGRSDDLSRKALKDHCTRMVDLQSSMRCLDIISVDEAEISKLLPTLHRLWPFLVLCLRKDHTSVVVRALDVMATATKLCGGEFFAKRFKNDVVPVLVGLLSQGLFSLKPKGRASHALVPDTHLQAPEYGPGALLNVQHAVLRSITAITSEKKSASAMSSSFEVVASWVVVLACQVEALSVAATETALALSTIDPDFVWILAADLVSGSTLADMSDVTLPGLPDFTRMLPAWQSQADALWCQYTAYRGALRSVDTSAAQKLLEKLEGL